MSLDYLRYRALEQRPNKPGELRSPCFMLGLDTETWMSFQWFSGGFLVI